MQCYSQGFVPPGSCVLAPDSLKINMALASDLARETWDKRAQIRKVNTDFPNHVFFLNPLVTDEHAGAFWFVGSTDDRAKANMTFATAVYVAHTGVELSLPLNLAKKLAAFEPRTSVKFSGKQPPVRAPDEEMNAAASGVLAEDALSHKASGVSTEDALSHKARIPILVNHKALAPGEVLLYFDEAKPKKREREVEPITIGASMKRMKKA